MTTLAGKIDRLSIKQLEVAHPSKPQQDRFLYKITKLCKGGIDIESSREELLVPRSGETDDEFQRRLKLFDYPNILGGALNEVNSKFSWGSSTLQISNQELAPYYESFEEVISPKLWLPKILREALKYQTVYAIYEPITVEGELKSLQAQRQAFKNYKPSISLYYPVNVLLEGEGWIKLKNTREVVTPLGEVYYEVRVRFIDSSNYYTFMYEKNKQGLYRLPGQTEWGVDVNETKLTPRVVPVFGNIYPVYKFQLPNEKWACNQIYQEQQTHTRIYNALVDAGAATGQLYKYVTPLKEGNSQALPKDLRGRTLKAGNTSILEVEKFGIAETSGNCLKALQEVLQSIENRIKASVMLSGMSYNQEAIKQSGVSKAFDNINIEASLREFGLLICSFYQSIINHYSLLIGDTEGVEVSGYDSFDLDSLDATLDVLERIQENPMISDGVKSFYAKKAEGLLLPNQNLDNSINEDN